MTAGHIGQAGSLGSLELQLQNISMPVMAEQLTVVGCALAFDAHPSFLCDGLVYHTQDWYTIAQQGYQGTKYRFACIQHSSAGQATARSKT